ncbi:MAG TPA: glycoside hydrolase family 18 protein [Gemmatimonadaceae bacterium]|nr:glycoside hydrolase family 18 protein [Gemmatimonadaceae bacterium]
MPYSFSVLALALMACATARSPSDPVEGAVESPRIVAYLASWGVRSKGTRIADLPGERLTHVIYAFGVIGPDGAMALADPCLDAGQCTAATTAALGGNFAQLRLLKQRHPHLKVLAAIGGWTRSGNFSDAALTPESRRRFAESGIALFMRRWPGVFDGFDIDWEYPVFGGMKENVTRPEDRQNFTLMLAELRRQLDVEGAREGRRYLLTAATAAGARLVGSLELDRIAPLLDWFNVMTYDYHSGSAIAHFNAPLHAASNDPTPYYNVDSTVAVYRRGGVPPGKIVIGAPFYGRAYAGVHGANGGLFQAATAPPREWATGLDYRQIAARNLPAQGFTRFWHAEALVPWLHNDSLGVFITYDDAESIGHKADYVRRHQLGGLMIWEIGGDDGTLLAVIGDRLLRERGTRNKE